MSVFWIVQRGAWSYIVSQRSAGVNLFPGGCRFPQFETKAEALLYCESLNAIQQCYRLQRSLQTSARSVPLSVFVFIMQELL